MFCFSNQQKTYRIGGVEIGGQPGERPTVVIGSLFFAGHRIVQDSGKGLFDIEKAKALLDREEELSAVYGNLHITDVIGDTAQALIRYIEFVATHSSSPILVDSPSQKVRLETVKYFAGSELIPRLIYNTIAEDHTDEELAMLKECGVKSAVILAFSTKALKPRAKINQLEEDLLPAAESAGIENILIDTGVLDITGVSWAAAAIHEVKECLGYPSEGTPAFESAASSVLALT